MVQSLESNNNSYKNFVKLANVNGEVVSAYEPTLFQGLAHMCLLLAIFLMLAPHGGALFPYSSFFIISHDTIKVL